MRAVVISMPKAGTYLAANLLQSLGMDFSHIHIDPGMYRIFKNNNLKDFDRFKGNVGDAVSNLKENQFAVGHIPFTKQNQDFLLSFKKVLMVRDKKEIFNSAKRYKTEKGLDVFSIINNQNLKAISRWSGCDDVFTINFSDIINNDVDKINDLQKYLFNKIKTDSFFAADKAKSMDSLTKSSIR